jgi:GT2 family glycosyltransferase
MWEDPGELFKLTSIIICTVDRLADLERCLASVHPFQATGAEVMVVNNGPHGAAVEEIANRNGARVIAVAQRGVSRSRNAGIRAATGNLLAFLDDDSVADPDWLPLLLTPFRDLQVLAVAGSIFPQTLADPVSQAFDYLHRAQFPESQLTMDANADKNSFPMRQALVGNANMAIRREAFERFGYFDTRLGRGTRIGSGEEPDFLLRVLLGGAKIAVVPAARILHRHATEWRAVRRWAFQSGCAQTALLTKYFLSEPSLRRDILRYAASRLRPPSGPDASSAAKFKVPRFSLVLGSLYGPIAFLLSGKN